MKTISIIGQKGGSGKSTLAVHVAVEATARGYVTAAIDADPQKSLYNWFELREAQAPEVIRETDADEMKKAVHRAAKGGCEILVIDTSGRAEATMRQAAELADIVLIPSKLEKLIASVNEVDFRGGIGAAIGQAALGGIAVMASSGRTGAKPAMPSMGM